VRCLAVGSGGRVFCPVSVIHDGVIGGKLVDIPGWSVVVSESQKDLREGCGRRVRDPMGTSGWIKAAGTDWHQVCNGESAESRNCLTAAGENYWSLWGAGPELLA
jgi:hypothetical protein